MLTPFSDFKEIFGQKEHEFDITLEVYKEGRLGEELDPRRFILTGFDGATDCKMISVFIGSCSKKAEHTWETLDEDRIVVTFKHDIGGFRSVGFLCSRRSLLGFGPENNLRFWDACFHAAYICLSFGSATSMNINILFSLSVHTH